nr:MAG TPA: hypothetical protein [Caudoviricetes sp.]
MEKMTTAQDVIDFFESSFADKQVIPFDLELIWLRKAISRYSLELDPLLFDNTLEQFDCVLDDVVISTLAAFMKELYQERQVSKVNKRVSIVGKDLSVGASDNSKKYTEDEYNSIQQNSRVLVNNQKPTAFV